MPSPYFDNYGVITLDAATVTLTDEGYVGSRIVLSRAAGSTLTLPPATGSGNRYEFIVGTTVTSNGYIIRVAPGTNIMAGLAQVAQDAGDGGLHVARAWEGAGAAEARGGEGAGRGMGGR
jgi:hypothetical protein